MKTKRKFTAGLWVIGFFKGEEIIGRTILRHNIKCVSLVTENGDRLVVHFNMIEDIKKINITETLKPSITSSIEKKKSHSAIDKLIMETLKSINHN